MHEPMRMHIGPWSKGPTSRAYRIDSGGRWSDGSTLRAFLMPKSWPASAHQEEVYIPAALADFSAYYFGHRACTMRLGIQRAAKSAFLTTDPPPQPNKTAKSSRLTTPRVHQGTGAAKSPRLTTPPNRIEPEDPALTGRHHSTDHVEPSRDRRCRHAEPAR